MVLLGGILRGKLGSEGDLGSEGEILRGIWGLMRDLGSEGGILGQNGMR